MPDLMWPLSTQGSMTEPYKHLTGSPTLSPLRSQFSSSKDTDLYKIQCGEAISPIQSSLHEVNQRVVLHGIESSTVILQQKSHGGKFKALTPESADVNKQRECCEPLESMGLSCQDKSQVTNASCSQLASRQMEASAESTPLSGAKRSSPVSSPRQESNKRLRNTPQKWNEHRSRIQSLYIDQGKSLTETMKSLEEEYGFKASAKIYKEKLKIWGLSKNKRTPNFQDRVRQLSKEFEGHEKVGKNAIGVGLEDSETSLCTGQSTPPNSSDYMASCSSGSIDLTWQGKDKKRLDEIFSEGKVFEENQNLVEAESRYSTAYQGYAHLLGYTNEKTLKVVRLIDHVCKEMKKPKRSELLLDDTIIHLCKKFGKDHPKTLSYMEALAVNYQVQRRYGDSEVVLGHILEAYERLYGHIPGIGFERSKQPILLLADAHVNQDETERARELLIHTLINAKLLALEDDDTYFPKLRKKLAKMDNGKSGFSHAFLFDSLHNVNNEQYLTILIVFLEFYEENTLDDGQHSSMQRFLLHCIGTPSQQCDQYRQLAKRLTISCIRSGNYRLVSRFRHSMQDRLDHELGIGSLPALSNLTRTGDLYHFQSRWEEARSKFQEGLERCRLDPNAQENRILDIQSCLQSISERTPLTRDHLLGRC